MYYKKPGNEPPVVKAGSVYEESYFHDGYLFLKYCTSNVPSEELIEITQEEYEVNKPFIPEPEPPEPEPTEQEILQAEMLLNQQQIISKQTEIDMTLAELLLNQQGV
ncbi:hypothetical protein [Anaerotignum sp.]|uniref:hypothetical protein n=1 Tax=Anaerotignum sp. TaxID=2039241 RepID=UPI0028A25F49|nr:hypothetical protein [Anaerotignum sp.]